MILTTRGPDGTAFKPVGAENVIRGYWDLASGSPEGDRRQTLFSVLSFQEVPDVALGLLSRSLLPSARRKLEGNQFEWSQLQRDARAVLLQGRELALKEIGGDH